MSCNAPAIVTHVVQGDRAPDILGGGVAGDVSRRAVSRAIGRMARHGASGDVDRIASMRAVLIVWGTAERHIVLRGRTAIKTMTHAPRPTKDQGLYQ